MPQISNISPTLPELMDIICSTSSRQTLNSGFWQRLGRRPAQPFYALPLKGQQRQVEVKTAAADRGDAPPAQRRKWRRLEERISLLKRQYNRGERTLNEYWDAVQHLLHNFV